MKLPRSQSPLFPIKIPSKGIDAMFRPFKTREEKILLIAQESSDPGDIMRALQQIIINCVAEGSEDKVQGLKEFDVAYMFVKLRARSVNNIIDFEYTPPSDPENTIKLRLDLNEVKMEVPQVDNTVKAGDLTLILDYPDMDKTLLIDEQDIDAGERLDRIALYTISEVYQGDDMNLFADFPLQERVDFINDLDVNVTNQIQEFFGKMPVISHELKYKGGSVRLIGLDDFFTWG